MTGSFKPWPAVILGVDPGKLSGWCIAICGDYVNSGTCKRDDYAALDAVAERAVAIGGERKLPCVLVLEHHPWGGRGSARAGLEAARQAWRSAWVRAGGHKGKMANANVHTWRSRVLGVTRGDQLLARELHHGQAFAGHPVTQDEAAAIGVTAWGARAEEVRKKLPARVLAAMRAAGAK